MHVRLCLVLTLLLPVLVVDRIEAQTNDEIRFFETKIRPVLVKHCYECHSTIEEKARGGLKLDTRDASRSGGDTAPAIVPRSPTKSLLYESIQYDDAEYPMPPKGKLPDHVIADFRRWIEMGAPDPRVIKHQPNAQSEIDIEEGKTFWAYQPPVMQETLELKTAGWPRTEIDRFVIAKLDEHGLHPVPDASSEVLIRRLFFNLIGLPPSSDQAVRWKRRMDAAIDEDAKQAVVAELISELLDSPHYGERWGRHWMDVARYAESTGGDQNNIYQHAWRYRDYVIDSFNDDKPFDQFIREQIAGDLLPIADEQEWADNVIASGFLALGVKLVGEEDQQKFFADLVDEQIDATTRAFLATTVACARCHDHKFDPIPQQDYYALAGIFRSTETHYGLLKAQARQATTLLDLTGMGPPPGTPKLDQKELAALIQERDDAAQAVTDAMNRIRSGENVFRGMLRRLRSQRDETEAALQAYSNRGEPRVFAMGTQDRDHVMPTRLLIRGEIDKPAQLVPRGVLQVLSPKNRFQFNSRVNGSGRLEFANWIAAKTNPLTARVIANRVWHWMFGQGLVRTVDDFGFSGDRPTHPELLDYLAIRLIENDWSIKWLVKEIAQSRTWQLASSYHAANDQIDPDLQWLWRMRHRRLEAEVIRDAMLAVSGQLELERPVGTFLREVGEGGVGQNVFEPVIRAMDKDVRSVYLPRVRNVLPEMLETFDAPDASLVSGARESTSSPLQSLFLMNSPFVSKQSIALAARVEDLPADQQIDALYRLVFARSPTSHEREIATNYLATETKPETPSGRFLGGRFGRERFAGGRFAGEESARRGFGGRFRSSGQMSEQTTESETGQEFSVLASYCQALLSTTEFQTID